MRVVVLGYIIRGPLGGLVWHHLQYVMGLARMGHDVYFFEDSDNYDSCYDPSQNVMTNDPSFGLKFASSVFEFAGLSERWAYFDEHRNAWSGPAASSALGILGSADLLLDLSGVNALRDWIAGIPHRALVDTDPVFTQVRHVLDEAKMQQARAHTSFFTYGENFGHANCSIPDDGLPWQPTRQPVVLDAWPVEAGDRTAPFSTIMQWDSYPAVEYKGHFYGMKSASFEPYMALPQNTPERLNLAIGSATAPRDRLRENGWMVSDPLAVTLTPITYQNFIRQSKAEFSVAKHGYQCSHSGWFSERSAAYLASGRPVVVQETGFSDWLQCEGGVLPFDSLETAACALERVSRDYAAHCRQARSVAQEYFDSAAVLSDLVEQATHS
jgi:hypothetical protein